jgi:hypothetical protein
MAVPIDRSSPECGCNHSVSFCLLSSKLSGVSVGQNHSVEDCLLLEEDDVLQPGWSSIHELKSMASLRITSTLVAV